jgi:hypothetical protein
VKIRLNLLVQADFLVYFAFAVTFSPCAAAHLFSEAIPVKLEPFYLKLLEASLVRIMKNHIPKLAIWCLPVIPLPHIAKTKADFPC